MIEFRDFWIDYPDEDWYAKVYCPKCNQVACHANDGADLGSLVDEISKHVCQADLVAPK